LSTADEHVRLKVQQGKTRGEDHIHFNISDLMKQIKLSNPVQSTPNLMNMDYPSTEDIK
jgi:hypothetical protein